MKLSSEFIRLRKAVHDSSNGVAYLGKTEDGRHARFASLLTGIQSRSIVAIQEAALVQRDGIDKDMVPGEITRQYYLDEQGREYPVADSSVELEALALTENEMDMVSESALRKLAQFKYCPTRLGSI